MYTKKKSKVLHYLVNDLHKNIQYHLYNIVLHHNTSLVVYIWYTAQLQLGWVKTNQLHAWIFEIFFIDRVRHHFLDTRTVDLCKLSKTSYTNFIFMHARLDTHSIAHTRFKIRPVYFGVNEN